MTLLLGNDRAMTAEVPAAEITRLRKPVIIGTLAVAVFFGGFLAFSWGVPLHRAAMASGQVVVEGSRRQVQHLEGGIVADILVREGQMVQAGEPVVRLDMTPARAQADNMRAQLLGTEAQMARLAAEAEWRDTVTFPKSLVDRARASDDQDVLDRQARIFRLRRDALLSQMSLLQQRTRQIEEEIAGTRGEIASQDRQLQLIQRELDDVRVLHGRGLERLPRLLALERAMAEIEGQRAQNVGRIARAEQAMVENEMRASDLRAQSMAEAAQRLRDEDLRAAELRERLRIAEDSLGRTTIPAPATGRVVNLRVFTRGGVIPPRESLMEIVPVGERLVVDAQLSPNDIDIAHVGADVDVRFVTLPQRTTPVLQGKLETVAADRQTDQRTGAAYYTARVVVSPEQMQRLGMEALPGMPVEISVKAGGRTLFDYLTQPLFHYAYRVFREK
jgi:HlyD family type I secretion membrane fusion protein